MIEGSAEIPLHEALDERRGVVPIDSRLSKKTLEPLDAAPVVVRPQHRLLEHQFWTVGERPLFVPQRIAASL